MKTVCNFCKTEYTLDDHPTMPVKCAVCGNVWRVPEHPRKNSLLIFIASLCALIAAVIFAFVIISIYQTNGISKGAPMVAHIASVETVVDDSGVHHFLVKGDVQNQSKEIYGVPNLIVMLWDTKGNLVAQQKFMPSATLLEAGSSVPFSHTLSASTAGVKKVSVKLQTQGE